MIATVTHARVRAAQGDVDEALRILRRVLASAPDDVDAVRLRDELTSRAAARLKAWIERVRERRGRPR